MARRMNGQRNALSGEALDKVFADASAATRSVPVPLRAAGFVLLGAVIDQLSRPGSGRLYRRRGVTHQASAPGEPPAVDRDFLRGSAGLDTVDRAVRVGVGAPYAEALEFGFVAGTQSPDIAVVNPGVGVGLARPLRVLQPRPFMRPALEASAAQMTDILVSDLQRGA